MTLVKKGPHRRKPKPRRKASGTGSTKPTCAVKTCRRTTVQRHHVRPKALKGTFQQHGKLLLCQEHHEAIHRGLDQLKLADPPHFQAAIRGGSASIALQLALLTTAEPAPGSAAETL